VGDQTVQLTVLLDLHDVVEDALESSIGRSVGSSHIEVYDLNDMAVLGLVTRAYFIEESFDDFLTFSSSPFLSYAFVEDLDGDALVGLGIDAHFDSASSGMYLLKRPQPNLKTTRYF
jgi:hypothetical protein